MPDAPPVITVFGSSRPVPGDEDYEEGRALGRALAERGFEVCTGGYGGIMEAVSLGAKEAGGHTLAVTARFFRAQANRHVDREIRVETWQDRLFELIRIGHGYVACRGGTGTLVELAVVWEMLNKGVMNAKPMVVLGEFWLPIVDRVRMVELGSTSPWGEAVRSLVHAVDTPTAAADHLVLSINRVVAQPPPE